MDPLAILGGFGELLNAVLSDFKPIGDREFAADQIFQGIEVFDYQRRHVIFFPTRTPWAYERSSNMYVTRAVPNCFAFRIGEIDASDTESRTDPQQARASENVSVGGGKEIVDFHFDRGDRALASEVPIECHAYSHVGYGSGDASVSHSGAVGQFVAQRALDGDAVAVGAGEFYSKQGVEWNSREKITNLFEL